MSTATEQRDVHRWARPVRYFESVADFIARRTTPEGVLSIGYRGMFLDLLHVDRGSDTTIIQFNPAILKRASEDVMLPIFLGRNVTDVDANVIFVSDPTLYLSKRLTLGWYAGGAGGDVQATLGLVLCDVLRRTGSSRTIFTGASGGGFASLAASAFFPGSLAIPFNPQTILAHFGEASLRAFLEAGYGLRPGEPWTRALARVPIHDLRSLYRDPILNRVLYVQNASDHHVELHQRPFFEALHARSRERVRLVAGDFGQGHVAPPAETMRQILSEAVAARDWQSFIDGFELAPSVAPGGLSTQRPAA